VVTHTPLRAHKNVANQTDDANNVKNINAAKETCPHIQVVVRSGLYGSIACKTFAIVPRAGIGFLWSSSVSGETTIQGRRIDATRETQENNTSAILPTRVISPRGSLDASKEFFMLVSYLFNTSPTKVVLWRLLVYMYI
jgi:hypothetical protein